jgi:squalene-hopene/tetraprenyl-beta-curcumene cyclase
VAASWDPKAAANYLDYRTNWWMSWNGAARDQGTFCVSCHTSVPYSIARPALRRALGENGLSADERCVLDDVVKRVRMWKDLQPYYDDHAYKPAESRGSEAVVNALILATRDAQNGHLSDDTRTAFQNMWSLQRTEGAEKGSWPWLRFDLEPWEAKDSVYYGAALAAVAVGTAPEDYRSRPEIQLNVQLLGEYLSGEYAKQSLMNRVTLLWASTKLPRLLDEQERKSLKNDVVSKQRPDGGWELPALAFEPAKSGFLTFWRNWIRPDGSLQDRRSDGYATAFIVFVLQQAGVDRTSDCVQRGLGWLMANQNKDGAWGSVSVNKRRTPTSDTGRFMTDAATAYAVLALTENQESTVPVAFATHH